MSYKIFSPISLDKLEKEVNAAMLAGWVPQGGVSVVPCGREGRLEVMHYQAMVLVTGK